MREGTVVRVRPRKVTVDLGGERVSVFIRGALKSGPKLVTHVVAVGDRVTVGGEDKDLFLDEVLPRNNRISRVDPGSTKRDIEHVVAANLDWFLVVVSLAQPRLNFRGLDRLLVLGEWGEVPCAIIFNKADIAEEYDPAPEAIYGTTGYPTFRVSAMTGEGLEPLREFLKGNVSLLAGPSGVGKTSLLNALHPELDLKTQPVSESTGKGVHTTTRVEWIDLPRGGALLDSPGIRSIQPFGLTGENLDTCFPEFHPHIPECKFRDCRHRDEPECAVKAALGDGQISESRYDGYLRVLQGVDTPEWWRRSIGNL